MLTQSRRPNKGRPAATWWELRGVWEYENPIRFFVLAAPTDPPSFASVLRVTGLGFHSEDGRDRLLSRRLVTCPFTLTRIAHMVADNEPAVIIWEDVAIFQQKRGR